MFPACGSLARLAASGCRPSLRYFTARCEGLPSPRHVQICLLSSIDASQEVSSKMEKETFYFGSYKIDASEVFLVTPHSYAFINLRPVVPGHILLSVCMWILGGPSFMRIGFLNE